MSSRIFLGLLGRGPIIIPLEDPIEALCAEGEKGPSAEKEKNEAPLYDVRRDEECINVQKEDRVRALLEASAMHQLESSLSPRFPRRKQFLRLVALLKPTTIFSVTGIFERP
ncbi:MAG: hypothetical protein GY822_25415 [Deltaproteobacteria bacterium]|nr:hypothetical protein [Deltaproteobacteria bacterium]